MMSSLAKEEADWLCTWCGGGDGTTLGRRHCDQVIDSKVAQFLQKVAQYFPKFAKNDRLHIILKNRKKSLGILPNFKR